MTPTPTPFPNGLAALRDFYGHILIENEQIVSPVHWEETHLTTLHVPAFHAGIRCHVKAAPSLKAIFDVLHKEGLDSLVESYDGCFCPRAKRGVPAQPSVHAWGAAIDLNAARFPLGSHAKQDSRLVALFQQHGWSWGGDFRHRPDPMHFQAAGLAY